MTVIASTGMSVIPQNMSPLLLPSEAVLILPTGSSISKLPEPAMTSAKIAQFISDSTKDSTASKVKSTPKSTISLLFTEKIKLCLQGIA
jgi:hypothetical protein